MLQCSDEVEVTPAHSFNRCIDNRKRTL